jgi:hypothetical protein
MMNHNTKTNIFLYKLNDSMNPIYLPNFITNIFYESIKFTFIGMIYLI